MVLATLAVVAYPTLAERDRRWVESIRASHVFLVPDEGREE